MIGIVSYGGYVPRLRLPRMTMFQNMAWFAPATIAVAQGERSVCNWDEDALSMGVEAARDCLKGTDKAGVDALFLASTTLPYADRQNAGIASTALNLKNEILTADFTGSLKAGTTAMISAFESLQSGNKNSILVAASDKREAKAGYFYEMWFGDGAASLLLGKEGVIAELKGYHSVSYDFPDHYRDAAKKYDYIWEERWIRDEGYVKILPEAINGLLSKYSLSIGDFSKVIYPCFFSREHAVIAKKIGASPQVVQGNMHETCGEMGWAVPIPWRCLSMPLKTPSQETSSFWPASARALTPFGSRLPRTLKNCRQGAASKAPWPNARKWKATPSFASSATV